MLLKRFLCTNLGKTQNPKWRVKQVMKSNFEETLVEIKSHISDCDCVAVSLQRTGAFSAGWHRPLSFDTAETAYCKARRAAERFQLLQFAVCPFSIRASKVVAHPYNFHLFPRDELNLGMPSYSFSCQSTYLTSMAREGFDFNACIYNGISYLSRAQESAAKSQTGNPETSSQVTKSSSTPSVADAVFIERIKSRVKHWKNNACKDSSKKNDDALVKSLRKLILGSEQYGSRPSINIDVCSERQVQLVLEMLEEFNDLVPIVTPAKGGGTQAVRVVMTSSYEDRVLFKKELENLEDEQNRKFHGFREVIDLISASQKPVVTHNSLNDFTFVHSKFLAPLPSKLDEFLCSLRLVFPHVLDINHLIMEISPLKKVTNLPSALSYLKKRFFAPIDMEIPIEGTTNEGKIHGHNVLRISHLFAKICSILKIIPDTSNSDNSNLASALESYTNHFNPCCDSSQESFDGDVRIWAGDTRKVSSDDLVFLWGFGDGMSVGDLKSLLQGTHDIFSREFDVRLVDNSCAVLVFWQPGMSRSFLEVMSGAEGLCGSLREMVSDGLRAACYETYSRACSLGLWESNLADSLDKASAKPGCLSEVGSSQAKPSLIYWDSNSVINLDDL